METQELAETAAKTASRTLHAIVNPAAGSGRSGKRWPGYQRHLAERGFSVHAHLTTGPGDAIGFAQRLAAEGAETILCVGGDGTANEVVNGLLVDGRPVNPATRLALIPCGTGKDLARSLGTRSIQHTIEALELGTTAAIDVGRMDFLDGRTGQLTTRYFVNVADTGLGAEVAARINRSSKALGGLVSYLTGAVRTIVVFKFRDATFDVDGHTLFSGRSGMAIFANGRHFAGGMLIAPDASLCDGLLDIFVLEDVGKRALLTSLLPRVYRGKHVGRPGVLHVRGAAASVRSPVEMLVEMDGEQVGRAPLDVSILPGVLRVVGRAQVLERAGGCMEPRP